MIVRVKLRKGRAIARKRRKNTQLALAGSALLYPSSLMAYVLGVWRLASDMGATGEFTAYGLFSHWQVWMVLGGLLNGAAFVLSRYGHGQDLPEMGVLRFGKRHPPEVGVLQFDKPRPESR